MIGSAIDQISSWFQVSAQPPAKNPAGQIKKETEVSYKVSGVSKYRIQNLEHRFGLQLKATPVKESPFHK
jgi:hypothetical protein